MEARLNDKQIQHLYWRAGFGISAKELKKVRSLTKETLVNRLFEKSQKINVLKVDLKAFSASEKTLTEKQKQEIRMLQNPKMEEINVLWMQQMQKTEGVLREKMTLFFQNHFSVNLQKPYMIVAYHNIIRTHALGSFRDLLLEVSKSAAMQQFLNNRQNRKESPNENFAREVMELFTLGRDNIYSQKDIKEAARAFTGWGVNEFQEFKFMKWKQDFEEKTILGRTGKFYGEHVIHMLLEQKQTAKFITKKLYQFLVNDKIEDQKIDELATVFYDSDYDIKTLLNAIFLSDWFYEEQHIGVKIKSPIELIVGINRQFNVKYTEASSLLFMQQKLNQKLFYPPNVAGWPGGKHWIDNSTLMLRLKLASTILSEGVIENTEKGEQTMRMMMQKTQKKNSFLQKKIQSKGQWNTFLSSIKTADKDWITAFLIQPKLSSAAQQIVEDSKGIETKNYVIALMSLPEYQLA